MDSLKQRWLARADVAMREAQSELISLHTRCGAAFDAGYFCALWLLGPKSLQQFLHPDRDALRVVNELYSADIKPALHWLDVQYDHSPDAPPLAATLAWAREMRKLVEAKRDVASWG